VSGLLIQSIFFNKWYCKSFWHLDLAKTDTHYFYTFWLEESNQVDSISSYLQSDAILRQTLWRYKACL